MKIGTYIIFLTLYSLIPRFHFYSHMIVLMTHQFHYQLFRSLHSLQSTLSYYLLLYHFTLLSFAVIVFTPSYILALPYTHWFFKLSFSRTVVLHSHIAIFLPTYCSFISIVSVRIKATVDST